MTIVHKHFKSAQRAIAYLENLMGTNDLMVFRGQQNSEHRLLTTYQRFTSIPHESWSSNVDDIIDKFKANLAKLGPLPFPEDDRASWLELAQHYGAPTPCLDFTYSPYAALFFAFNKLRGTSDGRKKRSVVVYALNVGQLAHEWARRAGTRLDGGFDQEVYGQAFREFHYQPEYFEHGFPGNTHLFVPWPSKHNPRMQRQHGAFLYDTLRYPFEECRDLEEFLESIQEPPVAENGVTRPGDPVLIKVYIRADCVTEVLAMLEMMGITGTMLYMDYSGAAMDTWNSYWYNPRSMYLRGAEFPPGDDQNM